MLSLPSALEPTRRFQMDESGFGLATCLDDIIGHDIDLFRKLETRILGLFTDIRAIRLKTVNGFSSNGSEHSAATLKPSPAKGIYFDTQAVTDLPASKMSDGVLLVLAYLTLLHLPKPPRLLLIEEPENGIHPQRLQDVIAILKEIITEQTATQVVMTTHSPYVLDMFSPNEVSLTRKEADGSVTVHRLSESELVRKQLDVFTLGEIWTAEGDEALIGTAETVP
ncbi:MAG: AAA family ATPase [Planctomycetaceae bacterium]